MDDYSSLSMLTLALAKKYTDSKIGEVLEFKIEIVATLPADPDRHTIYLLPKDVMEPTNGYIEYLYVNNKWEIIGETTIDLSDYYTKREVDDLFVQHTYVLPKATTETLGGIKLSEQFDMAEDGTTTLNEDALADLIEDNVTPIDNADISSLFNN